MADGQAPWERAHQEFAALPPRARNALVRAQFRTRAQIAATPDDVLLRNRMFGVKTLALVRAAYPYAPPPAERSPVRCLACGAELPCEDT